MAFDLIGDVIIPLMVGGGASATILFIGKSWLSKSIEHSFNLKIEEYKADINRGIEDYKAYLNRNTIDFQIEKSEFAKKKFDCITQLYIKVLEAQTRYLACMEDEFRTIEEVEEKFKSNLAFIRGVKDTNRLTSLLIDKPATDAVDKFCNLNFELYLMAGEIRKADLLKRYEDQKEFDIYKGKFNLKNAKVHFVNKSGNYDKLLDKVSIEMRKVLQFDNKRVSRPGRDPSALR